MKLLVALLSAVCVVAVLAFPSRASAETALTRYDMSVSVDWESYSLDASEKVSYGNNTGASLGSIVFNVHTAHFNSFTLNRAQVDGADVDATQDDVVLELPLSQPLSPGKTATIQLDFHLQVPNLSGRFGYGDNIMTLGNWFPIVSVYRQPRLAIAGQPEGWDRHPYGVGDPFFTEVADYHVEVTTSVPLVIAATGITVSNDDTHWVFEARRVRDFTMGLSPNFLTASRNVDGVEIVAYYLPQHPEAGDRYLTDATEMVQWLDARVGKYTQPQLRVVEEWSVDPLELGQEYPGLVYISSSVTAGGGGIGSYLSYLVHHEVAHQWFYSMIGDDQLYEPWLDEAMVTWLSYDFLRENYPDYYAAGWNSVLAGLRNGISIYGVAPVNSSIYDFPNEGQYFPMVYNRGAVFLEDLYQTMGSDAFFSFLENLFATFLDRVETGTAFLDMVQSFTDANLNPLIRSYMSYPRYQADDPLRLQFSPSLPTDTWSKTVNITPEATAPLTEIKVLVDDAVVTTGTGEVNLDTRQIENGDHLLTVVGTDAAGRTSEAVRVISVRNAPEPTPTRLPTETPTPVATSAPAATSTPGLVTPHSADDRVQEQASSVSDMKPLGAVIIAGIATVFAYLLIYR